VDNFFTFKRKTQDKNTGPDLFDEEWDDEKEIVKTKSLKIAEKYINVPMMKTSTTNHIEIFKIIRIETKLKDKKDHILEDVDHLVYSVPEGLEIVRPGSYIVKGYISYYKFKEYKKNFEILERFFKKRLLPFRFW